MKVVCQRLNDGLGNTRRALSVGRSYLVYAVAVTREFGVEVRIVDDDGGLPGLFPIGMFDLIDSSLSRGWVAALDSDGYFQLGPPTWVRVGFWEDDYVDESGQSPFGLRDAADSIQKEMRAIELED